jgi:hypothetical protein
MTACPACGTPIEKGGECSRCRSADAQAEQVEAIDFVVRRVEGWYRDGRLTDRQWQGLSEMYARERLAITAAAGGAGPSINMPRRDRCWSCKESLAAGSSHCDACGAPASGPAVKSLRFCRFLSRELDNLEAGGTITLRQAHELVGETQERIAAIKQKLEKDRALMVEAVPRANIQVRPRRSAMEVLLDPRSIQWLLATGGGLLVLGLVIWLSSLGLFDNPGVVAACLGIGNGVVLLGGWALVLRTRYQFAGRALTLLACLVMPLNLWFYHTHNLITLDGHLWVAALACSVIYAVSALVLKDPLFVYVLVGGITLTGILLLGDKRRLDEIAAPVTMLVVLSLICLHAERAFPPDDSSPFSRERFGMAFYWCAQALLASGLLILLSAQLIGWLHEPLLRHIGFVKPAVAERAYLPWTLALVLAGTYALIYSDIVVRRIGVYLYLAAITVLWAEIQLLILLDFAGSEAVVIITLSLTALAVNFLQVQFEEKHAFLRTIPPLGVLLSVIPIMFGVLLHFRATNRILNELWPFQIDWALVAAMFVTALATRAAAHLYRKAFPELSAFYFFATAGATLLFAAEFLWMLGLRPWEAAAPVLMLIPILYLVAAQLYRGHSPERPLIWCAHASTGIMLVCSLYVAAGVVPQVADVAPITGKWLNLLLAVFCLETAVFYGLAAGLHKAGWNIYLATVMMCGAIWQVLNFVNTPTEIYPLAFTLLGLALLVAYRFALLESWDWAALSRAGFHSANALTTLGFAAGMLLSLTRLLLTENMLARLDNAQAGAGDWHNPVRLALYLMGFLSAAGLVAAWLVQQAGWRRAYIALAIASGALTALLFHRLHPMNPWQTLEVVSILTGIALVVLGHVGWYRESDERISDTVSLALLFGCAAVVIPLGIATVVHRFGFEISPIDELGLVFACVVLLGSGVMCRLKAPTLFGSIALTLYVLMVLIYMHRFLKEQVLVGIYLTLGGALLFGVGLVLSVYRDRLLKLPEKIKRREGVFRVFGWR